MRYFRLSLTLLFLLSGNLVFAQGTPTVLKGFLGVAGGESYTYKLAFTDSSGFLKGHAYTYLHEGKEVKAEIIGFIDRTNKTLSFRETNIVYNHGFESNTTICLIHAILVYTRGDDGRETYSGPITSSDISNVYCGRGTVSFPYNESLKAAFVEKNVASPIPEKAVAQKPAQPVKIIYDTARTEKAKTPHPKLYNNEPEKITAGKDKTILWYTDSIVIEIYDGGRNDGDIVSLFYNGEEVLKNLRLQKNPVKKVLLVKEENVTIIIVAENEGNEPPNSAHVLLRDGTRKHTIIAYNDVGKRAVIKLRKVK